MWISRLAADKLSHVWQGIWDAVHDPPKATQALSVSLLVAEKLNQIPRKLVSDMPDRIVTATALAYGLPLVTSDAQIRQAPVPTIW